MTVNNFVVFWVITPLA